MIPALLSAVGVSLSEFADSLIVGNLLNEQAFEIVNLCTPIVFMTSMIYTITGVGGSLLYAEYLAMQSILPGRIKPGLMLILRHQ